MGIRDGDWGQGLRGSGAWCSTGDAVSGKKYQFQRLAVTNMNKSQLAVGGKKYLILAVIG